MFTKKQLEIIKKTASEGWPINVAASQLGMTFNKFIDEYNDNEEAQIAWESGIAQVQVKLITVAMSKAEQGDQKSMDFIAGLVMSSGSKSNIAVGQPGKTRKVEVPSILLNPKKLLDIDDLELQRKQEEKAQPKSNKKIDDEED